MKYGRGLMIKRRLGWGDLCLNNFENNRPMCKDQGFSILAF